MGGTIIIINMTNDAYFKNIRNLIAQNELDEAIKQLQLLLKNSPKLDETILQSARFHDIRRQIRLGLVSHAEANLTQNQIHVGLLDLLREIEEQSEKPTMKQEMERAISIFNSKNMVVDSTISAGGNVEIGDRTIHTESETSRRLRLFLYFFVPVLAIGAAFFWFQFQKMKTPLALKVRIENRTPNPELPEPKSNLSLTVGQKTEPKTGLADEALFEEISANFRGERLRLQFSAPGFVPIDTAFSFDNELLVLPVRRNDDLATLAGFILDEAAKPLEGAKVSIACCDAITDSSGKFVLNIPFQHQRTSQRLDISRTGFEAKSITTPVIPGEILRQGLVKTAH